MDIANYIGLFLLKNHFCYIHGLGNLELKKKAATYENDTLQPSSYEVILTPSGSIDDNLANFIATNEQTSISKAANALKDFSTQARADMQQGKEVPIPHIGKFVEDNGRVQFITDPKLEYTPAGLPALKTRINEEIKKPSLTEDKTTNTYEYPSPSGSTVDWKRIGIAAAIVILIGGAIVAGVMYINKTNDKYSTTKQDTTTTATVVTAPQPKKDTVQQPVAPAVNQDTVATNYQVIINAYDNKKKAEGRLHTMKDVLKKDAVLLTSSDSASYFVALNVNCKPVDTTHIVDSLGKLYNTAHADQVHIYHAAK